MLEGFDVSAHNPIALAPWHEVAFGFARISHGRGLDKSAPAHLARMAEHGVERGAYHYLRGDSTGHEQAEVFWDAVCDLGGGESFALAMDLEHLKPPAPPWDRKVYRRRALDFLKRIRELSGRTCAVYSYRHHLGEHAFTAAEVIGAPLWLSDITGAVEVPKPWQDWTVHQYSYGENNTLDHNRFDGTREDWRQLFGIRPSPSDVQTVALAGAVRAAEGRGASVEDFVSVPEGPRIEGGS